MSVKLKDICSFQSGGTPSKGNPEYFNGSIPWITTVALNGRLICEEDAIDWITEKAIQESAAKVVPAKSIMVGTRVGVGKVAINEVPMSTSQDIISLLDIDEKYWNKEFLCKFLQSKAAFLNSKARGATIKGIKIDDLAGLTIPDVSLADQQTIVVSLNRILDVIASRRQQLQALDTLIKARFVEMFGTVHDDRFPKCKLRELAHIKHGFAFSGEFFSEIDNGIVLVTPGNFAIGGGFQETKNRYFTSEYPQEYVLHAGDLIVTMTDLSKKADTLGYGAIVPSTGKIYLHNQRIGLFDKLDQKLDPIFMRWFMQTSEYREEIVRTSTGSTVHHTSPDRILDSIIFIPPIGEQIKFRQFAEQIDKSKIVVQAALDKAQLLFDSLMQQYFG